MKRWRSRKTAGRILAALLACAFLTSLGHAADGSYLRPDRIGGVVAMGYHWNVLGSSKAEQDAFETPNEDYFFVVDRLNDTQADFEVFGRWDLPSFYKTMRLDISYGRLEWVHDPILGSNRYEAAVRQRLPGGSQVDLDLAYQPQVYLRHRSDKDAQPGDPEFRPEAVRKTEVEVTYSRPWSVSRIGFIGGYEGEDRTEWFTERDEKSVYVGVFDRLPVSRDLTVTPRYDFNRTRSRNKPDLGSDRSYYEHALGLTLNRGWLIGTHGLATGLYGRLRYRTYTTSDPTDTSRYDRKDLSYNWNLRVTYPTPRVSPFMSIEQSGRIVDLPSGADVSTEDGEYTTALVRLGIEWEIRRD